jgi:hypothetical protein
MDDITNKKEILNYEQNYGKMIGVRLHAKYVKKQKEYSERMSKFRKGKSFEELFGPEKATIYRKNLSKALRRLC